MVVDVVAELLLSTGAMATKKVSDWHLLGKLVMSRVRIFFRRLFKGKLVRTWPLAFEADHYFVKCIVNNDLSYVRAVWKAVDRQTPKPKTVTVIDFNANGVPVKVVRPSHLTEDTIRNCIVFFHGGSFVHGSFGIYQFLLVHMALATNSAVCFVDYKLAPENRFPAGLNDCVNCYLTLRESEEFAKKSFFLAGDSAGGNLVCAVLLKLRDAGNSLPAGAICISPAVDLSPSALNYGSMKTNSKYDFISWDTDEGAINAYVDPSELSNPYVSPMFADLSSMPPVLLLAGDLEILRDQIAAFHERLSLAGSTSKLVVYEDMIHCFQIFESVPKKAHATYLKDVGDFVNMHSNKSS